MNAMKREDYDLVEITRLLLDMRDNCLPKEGDAYDDPKRNEKHDALNAAIDLINNPSCLESMSNRSNWSNWISVKERAPERYERVLFFSRCDRRVCVGSYHGEGWRGVHYFMNVNRIETALWWMPLPEPPKEGK